MTEASPVFEWVCAELERMTPLTALQARGTMRTALDEAGLGVASVMRRPMGVVLRRLLPRLLDARGVPEAARVCAALADALEHADLPELARRHDAPEDVFARLGGTLDDDRTKR
jgi:hypothetical protein